MIIKPIKRIRYRSENFSGSEVRDAAKVMAYEIYELGNSDILRTLSTTILKNVTMIPFDKYIYELETIGYIKDLSYEDILQLCKDMLYYINIITGYEVKYALWLADMDTMTELYAKYNDDVMDQYAIGDIVLSEIGYDGTLYGYNICPDPINKINLML